MNRKTFAQMMGEMDNNPFDTNLIPTDNALDTNPMVNDLETNPSIESYAKPASVTVKDENGTVHSFSVEIKSSKNGPIPDTQLMSKILEAVEGSNSREYSAGGEEPTKFEVVSFKYERRDGKK